LAFSSATLLIKVILLFNHKIVETCLKVKITSLTIIINNFVALSETVEVGCPRHPGATTIGNQLQDGDCTDGWQNLTSQP